MSYLQRSAQTLLLGEIAKGMLLTLRYMFRRRATVNYPYEKGPLSPRFRGELRISISRFSNSARGDRSLTFVL